MITLKSFPFATARLYRLLVPLLLLLCELLLGTGCGSAHAPHHLLQGFDTSAGFRTHLPACAEAGAHLGGALIPETDSLTLYRVDSDSEEFRSDQSLANEEQLQDELTKRLSAFPSAKGTFPAAFWKDVANRTATETRRTAIVLWSDGDNDDAAPQSDREIRDAARRLASNPHVAVVALCGAAPANWRRLREQFAPLGNRLLLFAPENVDLASIQQRFEADRK